MQTAKNECVTIILQFSPCLRDFISPCTVTLKTLSRGTTVVVTGVHTSRSHQNRNTNFEAQASEEMSELAVYQS